MDLPERGLEIPCTLMFTLENTTEMITSSILVENVPLSAQVLNFSSINYQTTSSAPAVLQLTTS